MANLPMLLNLLDELKRETYSPLSYEQDFAMGLPLQLSRRQELLESPAVGSTLPLRVLAERQLANFNDRQEGPISRPFVGRDGFQVCVDVTHFKPNELQVKVVDNCIVVEGKHEERNDGYGYITRQFTRRYTLPEDYDSNKVMSTLSSDGVLTVSVPKPQAASDAGNERIIQIQQTGPAHLNIKQNPQCDTGSSNGNTQ